MRTKTWQSTLLAVCFAIAAQPLWADSASDKTPPTERDIGSDRFVAACPVSVERPVAGDLMAAGCHVDVRAEVGGDVFVAGGELRLTAPIKQSLYAAGGHVSIEAPVQRNVRIAGGSLVLGPAAKIAGNVTVAGGDVTIDGAIGGYLLVGAGNVRINAPVAGDVEVGAGTVELGPNARIDGKLTYASGEEMVRDPAALVQGGVERIERAGHWPASRHWRMGSHNHHHWIWSLGMLVIAAILMAAFPDFYKRVTETVRTRWGWSLLFGFIALVCVPFAALIVMVTIIGIPLALAMIALYLVLLLLGYVSSGIALGDAAMQRWGAERAAKLGWRILAAVLAMLAISLLGRVPFVGGLVTLVAMVTGIGLLLMQLQSSRAATAAPTA